MNKGFLIQKPSLFVFIIILIKIVINPKRIQFDKTGWGDFSRVVVRDFLKNKSQIFTNEIFINTSTHLKLTKNEGEKWRKILTKKNHSTRS